jgi:hypothetical protein
MLLHSQQRAEPGVATAPLTAQPAERPPRAARTAAPGLQQVHQRWRCCHHQSRVQGRAPPQEAQPERQPSQRHCLVPGPRRRLGQQHPPPAAVGAAAQPQQGLLGQAGGQGCWGSRQQLPTTSAVLGAGGGVPCCSRPPCCCCPIWPDSVPLPAWFGLVAGLGGAGAGGGEPGGRETDVASPRCPRSLPLLLPPEPSSKLGSSPSASGALPSPPPPLPASSFTVARSSSPPAAGPGAGAAPLSVNCCQASCAITSWPPAARSLPISFPQAPSSDR